MVRLLAISGETVGGIVAAVVTWMAKQPGGPRIAYQVPAPSGPVGRSELRWDKHTENKEEAHEPST